MGRMSLYIASLNSGSNGNSYYIGNDSDAILIDAGISCRETERRLKRLSLPVTNLKAIFISHEHIDHISGLPVLSKKYQLPVYITPATLGGSLMKLEKHLVHGFQPEETVPVGGLAVTAFTKSHDAVDPHSFIVSYKNRTVGVFTDIGEPCQNVKRHFSQCDAAFLETNYCEQMLANGNYPAHLKKRISGRKGHLSNAQALDLFLKCNEGRMRYLFLSHLSQNNNSPEAVSGLFSPHAGETEIIIASRYAESKVIRLDDENHFGATIVKKAWQPTSQQLSLFPRTATS